MRRLHLVRHGETDWNRQYRWQGHTDVPLNETGREQARALAERLRAVGVRRVHASDLSRARETAEIVAGLLGAPFRGSDAGLRERGFGAFEGLTREECEAQHPDAWRAYIEDRSVLPDGAETQLAVARRMLRAVHAIAFAHDEDPIVIVSHGAAIRTFMREVTGRDVPIIANGGGFELLVDPEEPEPARAFRSASE